MVFWFGATAAGIVLIAAILCLSSIRIRVRYSRSGKLDQLIVIVHALYGLVRIRSEIPSIVMKGTEVVYRQRKHAQAAGASAPAKKDKRRINTKTLKRWLAAGRLLQSSILDLKEWTLQVLGKIECTRWRMDVTVGTGDAAMTGIVAGLFWSILGVAQGMTDSFMKMRTHPHGNVKPIFSGKEFSLVWEADFRIRLGTVLGLMMRLGGKLRRVRGAMRAMKAWKAAPGHA